ncbi:MAG: hypothetical protein ACYC9S_10880 [Leptospirales bacterium]
MRIFRQSIRKKSPLPNVRLSFVDLSAFWAFSFIFYLQSAWGGSVQGLAILTAVVQTFGATGIVLFFTAFLEYVKDRDASDQP